MTRRMGKHARMCSQDWKTSRFQPMGSSPGTIVISPVEPDSAVVLNEPRP